jgi:hypothetical protein
MAKTRRADRKPETPADKRFFDLRESGYRGPIDQDGYPCRTTGKGINTRFVRDKRFVPGKKRGR